MTKGGKTIAKQTAAEVKRRFLRPYRSTLTSLKYTVDAASWFCSPM